MELIKKFPVTITQNGQAIKTWKYGLRQRVYNTKLTGGK